MRPVGHAGQICQVRLQPPHVVDVVGRGLRFRGFDFLARIAGGLGRGSGKFEEESPIDFQEGGDARGFEGGGGLDGLLVWLRWTVGGLSWS